MIDAVNQMLRCFNWVRSDDIKEEKMHIEEKYIFPPDPLHNLVFTLDAANLNKCEVDIAFPRLLAELDLSPENQKLLLDQPIEKKCLMLTEQNAIRDKYGIGNSKIAEKFLEMIQEHNLLDSDNNLYILEALFISLRTQSHSYVESFVKLGGSGQLKSLLSECPRRPGLEQHAAAILLCFRALLNSTVGRLVVLSSNDTLCVIASSTCLSSAKCKVLCYEILAGICLIPDGHQKVLHAITDAHRILGERTRFQRLVDDIYRNYGNDRETDRVRTAAMSLINALLSTGPAEKSLEFRMHLRFELLMLGLHNILEQLRATSSTVLDDHFDLFEMSRQEDEQHFARRDSGTSTPIDDVENPADIVDILMERLNNTIAMPHFISILQHLMLVSSDHKHTHIWRLLDIVLQQLVLQAKMEVCTDLQGPVISIDINKALSRLHTQHEYDNLERMYNELEEELRKERMNVIELQNRLADCDLRSIYSRISADSTDSTFPSDPCESPSPSSSSVPPICPPLLPPPPPPPSLLQLGMHRTVAEAIGANENAKKIPKSTAQLKTLNWITIPKDRIFGTVWENINEEKLYEKLNLEDVTQNFSISKISIDETESVSETLRRQHRAETSISVIEPRRAQNCTIMLSKLRLSNKQIKHAILSMDQYGELPRDMIEQMLKFLPTKEEIMKIREIVDKYKTASVLSVADRFFYEISNVPRHEERLRCLHIISTYRERISDISSTVETVTNASTAVTGNKRLRQLLRIILAVGNFLNCGKRNGNAYGFTLASLRLLTDVRNSLRSDRNLLHYIVEQFENKKSDVLGLKRDLESVYQAARHSRKEMEQELCALRKSISIATEALKDTEAINEGDTWNNERDKNVDRFVEVLKNFLNSAQNDFAQVEKQYADMDTKFRVCVRMFAEETRNTSPDDFFGIISKFLTALTECHQQIWEERENLERLKKQTMARSILSKRSRQRENHSRNFDQLVTALQSGEIFSEELTRLRTSFRSRKKLS
uniref:FH2 domain-containing protein n=3 Tax=Wuchereria bancrofti TaxID=6293 RepID=A0AAF5RV93_WUCBA